MHVLMNLTLQPAGGIRYWNEYDAVPYLALVVGFQLGGIPVKMKVTPQARELFEREQINGDALAGIPLDVVVPHIIYQIGPLVYTYPVFARDITNLTNTQPATYRSEGFDLEL